MRIVFLFILTVLMGWPFAGCSQEENIPLQKRAEHLLESGDNISALLSNFQFDSLRTEDSFRELIKQHANPGVVTMVSDEEAGVKILVRGQLKNAKGKVLTGTLVYVYQTDSRGWYGSDRVHFNENSGDEKHARLFAYLRTDTAGKFEFNTVQPKGYPQSDLPAHIHIEVFDKGKMIYISELLFDDDERLVGDRRTRSESEGFIISKPVAEKGKKIFEYSVVIK